MLPSLRKVVFILLLLDRGFAHAGSIDYVVPGPVSLVPQGKTNGCWAAVTTMLYSWKSNATYPVETALAKLGGLWLARYTSDSGLSSDDTVQLLKDAALVSDAPQSYTIDGFASLLKQSGPVWVTTRVDARWLHARVVRGIKGDGTVNGTRLMIVDPAPVDTGSEYLETYADFVKKYEDGASFSVLVVHYPAKSAAKTPKK